MKVRASSSFFVFPLLFCTVTPFCEGLLQKLLRNFPRPLPRPFPVLNERRLLPAFCIISS